MRSCLALDSLCSAMSHMPTETRTASKAMPPIRLIQRATSAACCALAAVSANGFISSSGLMGEMYR
ncbi:hypothetical protein APR52_39835 [Variovorax paradoxus]|nr:hypothetical protein APR52_39835 [Variovorax paradoxus]